MTNSDRIFKCFVLFCLTLLLSWGCSNQSPSSVQSPSSISSLGCRSVSHEAGLTEICQQPLTIVALSPYVLDIMLALGVEPVGYAAADLTGDLLRQPKFEKPDQQIPYIGNLLKGQPVNLGDRHAPSLEAIARLHPDLILGERWQGTQGRYDLLTKIAPTVLVDDQKGGWEHSIEIISKALDQRERLLQVKSEYAAKVAIARTQLESITKKYPRVLLISSGNLAQGVYLYADSEFSRLLELLGFQLVSIQGDSLLSLEIVPQIKADIIVVVAWSDADRGGARGWKKLEQEWNQIPLLRQMSVSQANRVFAVDARLSTIRGPLAAAVILERYRSFLLPLS